MAPLPSRVEVGLARATAAPLASGFPASRLHNGVTEILAVRRLSLFLVLVVVVGAPPPHMDPPAAAAAGSYGRERAGSEEANRTARKHSHETDDTFTGWPSAPMTLKGASDNATETREKIHDTSET